MHFIVNTMILNLNCLLCWIALDLEVQNFTLKQPWNLQNLVSASNFLLPSLLARIIKLWNPILFLLADATATVINASPRNIVQAQQKENCMTRVWPEVSWKISIVLRQQNLPIDERKLGEGKTFVKHETSRFGILSILKTIKREKLSLLGNWQQKLNCSQRKSLVLFGK